MTVQFWALLRVRKWPEFCFAALRPLTASLFFSDCFMNMFSRERTENVLSILNGRVDHGEQCQGLMKFSLLMENWWMITLKTPKGVHIQRCKIHQKKYTSERGERVKLLPNKLISLTWFFQVCYGILIWNHFESSILESLKVASSTDSDIWASWTWHVGGKCHAPNIQAARAELGQ